MRRMFDNPAPTTAEAITPPAETRKERRMHRLEQMSELGLSIGRKLERQAEMASAYAELRHLNDRIDHSQSRRVDEIARAFAQVLRAVSLATAIEDRIDQGLPAIPDLERSRRLREQAAKDRRDAVECAVECAIHADPRIQSPRRLADLKINLHRLLDREVLNLDAFLNQPLPQIIARLRAQLGLEPEEEPELWDENSSLAGGQIGTAAQQPVNGMTDAELLDGRCRSNRATPIAHSQTSKVSRWRTPRAKGKARYPPGG